MPENKCALLNGGHVDDLTLRSISRLRHLPILAAFLDFSLDGQGNRLAAERDRRFVIGNARFEIASRLRCSRGSLDLLRDRDALNVDGNLFESLRYFRSRAFLVTAVEIFREEFFRLRKHCHVVYG